MPILIVIMMVVQIACLIHAYRTGRGDYWWYLAILGLPLIGCAAYVALAVYDDVTLEYELRQAKDDIFSGPDDTVDLGKLRRDLDESPTIENRQRLAQGMVRKRDFAGAIREYQTCLQGFRNDPRLLLEFSLAQFLDGRAEDAKKSLESLASMKPDFEPGRRKLLTGRVLERLGDIDGAIGMFAAAAEVSIGEEAACRHGLALKKARKDAEAAKAFEAICLRAKRAARLHRLREKKWISLAKANLAS